MVAVLMPIRADFDPLLAFGAFVDRIHHDISLDRFSWGDQFDLLAFEVVKEARETGWCGGLKFGYFYELSVFARDLQVTVQQRMSFRSAYLHSYWVGDIIP